MQISKQSSNCIQTQKRRTISLKFESAGEVPAGQEPSLPRIKNAPVLHSFENSQPLSFSERFPRLTCFLVACGIFTAALVTEIDCLHGAGYYWR